jgi:tetratricopeptide (TPR) repeat protein
MMCFTASRRALRVLPLALALAALPLGARADLAVELGKMRSASPQDRPLFVMQAGLAAMAEGQVGQSAELFDSALAGIEGMYANTEGAARARSLWYEEGAKEFKGEPYERAMAYYYRGLLYLAEGDYENARASFRSGLLQDAFAEEDQNRSDFAMLMMLEGWANQLHGDAGAAREAYGEVRRLRPNWREPGTGDNVLVVAELGGSPRKLGDGIGNHEIVYRRPKRTPERHVSVTLDGKPAALAPLEDVYVQAATRGGRPIDRVIDGKVTFQSVTGNVGSALTNVAADASLLASLNGGADGRALGAVAAVGAISAILSANVKPRADVRYWANLPETLHVTSFHADALPQDIRVALTDDNGNQVPQETLRIQTWRDKRGNALVWIKSRN